MSMTLQTFQFHEGPIKTVICHIILFCPCLFQFHEGPIKTVQSTAFVFCYLCFNSMKVRLKHAVAYEDYTTPAVSIP